MENKNYYITLTGAKKNVGDFLITERALALLKYFSNCKFIKYPSWECFKNIDIVNNSLVIILGGPGFQMNMYPGVYKLADNIKKIKVPIYTLGSGWKGLPGDRTSEKLYKFTDSTKVLLNLMENTPAGMSCRDYQTVRVLNNNGCKNITMTGCPVWYDIASLGKPFNLPQEIMRIVFTPAQNPFYCEQSIEIMSFLKKKFKNSQIIVSFHRGIGKTDDFTKQNDAQNTQILADCAKKLHLDIRDVSYSSEKLNFYNDCDLHIGYRVHGHLYFLSKRLPSILIHEDGRGNGVTEALKTPGINAYQIPKFYSKIFGMFKTNKFLAQAYSKLGLKLNGRLIEELNKTLNEIQNTDYQIYRNTSRFIDKHFQVMQGYIEKILTRSEALK